MTQVEYKKQKDGGFEVTFADEMPEIKDINKIYTIKSAGIQKHPYSSAIFKIPKYTPLTPTEKGDHYFKVLYDGHEYWIHAPSVVTEKKYKHYQKEVKSLMSSVNLAQNRYKTIVHQCNTLSDSLSQIVDDIPEYRQLKYYFQGIPEPTDTDRTNSQGELELTLTQNMSYYLVA